MIHPHSRGQVPECGSGGCRGGESPVMLEAKAVRVVAQNQGTGIILIR